MSKDKPSTTEKQIFASCLLFYFRCMQSPRQLRYNSLSSGDESVGAHITMQWRRDNLPK